MNGASKTQARKRITLPLLCVGLMAPVHGEVLTTCDEASLRAAIAVGGTLEFACPESILVTSPIFITNEVTLSGPVTLSGNGTTRLFEVGTEGNLRLIKVTLSRGTGTPAASWLAGFGGAILNTGSVSAVDCIFSMNQAFGISSGPNVGPTTDGVGGAIYNEGQFTATGCWFDRNASYGGNGLPLAGGAHAGASAFGGAVFSRGTAAFSRCVFVGNQSVGGKGSDAGGLDGSARSGGHARGGAIYNEGAMQIDTCTFSFNTLTGGVGGVGFVAGGKMDAGWSGSGGSSEGAAIYQSMGSNWITASLIASNSARGANGVQGTAGRSGGTVVAGGTGGLGGSGGSVRGVGVCIVGGSFALTNSTVYFNSGWAGDGANGGDGGPCLGSRGRGGDGANGGAGGDAKGIGVFVDNATAISINNTLASNRGTNGAGSNGGLAGSSCQWFGPRPTNGLPGRVGGLAGDNAAVDTGSFILLNTILAYGAWQNNGAGVFTDAGHNLSSDGSCRMTNMDSMEYVSPWLGLLTTNKGLTLTTVPAPGSPAVDHGDDRTCPATDQRGEPRPRGLACDIGAVEGTDGVFFPVVTMSFAPGENRVNGISRLQFSVTNMNSFNVSGIAFTNSLPTGVVVADLPNLSKDCPNGTVVAPQGSSRIGVSGMQLSAGASCRLSVDVLILAEGTHTNILHEVGSAQTGFGPLDTLATLSANQGSVVHIVPLAGGQMALDLIGLPGLPYVFDATTNWTDWSPLSTNVTASNGRTYFIDLDAPQHPRRFYRALNRAQPSFEH